jgi:tetratricopeptide (TPR) repeat protein
MFALRFALLVLLVAAPPEASPEAGLAFQRGRAAYTAGAFEEAIAQFSTAFRLYPNVKVLFNLGLAHDKAGHKREALETFQRFDRELEDARPEDLAGVGDQIEGVRDRVKQLESELADPAGNGPETLPTAVAPAPGRTEAPVPRGPANGPLAQRLKQPPETILQRPRSIPLAEPTVTARAARSAWPRWWVVALGVAATAAVATAVVVWSNGRCPGRGDLGCF